MNKQSVFKTVNHQFYQCVMKNALCFFNVKDLFLFGKQAITRGVY